MLKNLKTLREEYGISQKSLADEIGVSQQSINKYENHNIEPDISTLIRIANYFDTSIDFIVGHTKTRSNYDISDSQLSQDELDIISKYRALYSKQKNCIITILDSYK